MRRRRPAFLIVSVGELAACGEHENGGDRGELLPVEPTIPIKPSSLNADLCATANIAITTSSSPPPSGTCNSPALCQIQLSGNRASYGMRPLVRHEAFRSTPVTSLYSFDSAIRR